MRTARTVREMPMIDHNTFADCEELRRGISFKPLYQLQPGEHIKTECRPVRDRWQHGEKVVQL